MATYNVFEKGILTEPKKEGDDPVFNLTDYGVEFFHEGVWEKVPYSDDKPEYLEEAHVAEGIVAHAMQNGRVARLRSHNPELQEDVIDIDPRNGNPTTRRAVPRDKLDRIALKIHAELKTKS